MLKKISEDLVRFIVNVTTGHPWKVLLANLLLILPMAYGLKWFREDYDIRLWFQTNDPNVRALDEFEKQFGSDDALITLVHNPKGIFKPESMKLLARLTKDMWQVPNTVQVESMVNFMDSTASQDEISVSPFMNEKKAWDQNYLSERRETALKHPIINNYLVNKTGDTALIVAKLKPRMDGAAAEYGRIDQAHKAIIASYGDLGENKIYVTGLAAINSTFRSVGQSDIKLMVPLLTIMMVGTLFYYFRSWGPIIFPGLTVAFASLCTIGLMGWLNYTFNNLIGAIPALLIAVCMAGAIHMIVNYYQALAAGKSLKDAIAFAINKNLKATFFTSVTTAVGFWALDNGTLIPVKEMGILAGWGTMIAWLFSFTMIVPCLVIWPMKVNAKTLEEDLSEPGATEYNRIEKIKKYRWPIIISYLGITATAAFLATKVEVNSNPIDYFPDDNPLSVANRFQLKAFGGSTGPEIVLNSGIADGINSPEFLSKVDKLNTWLLSQEYVSKTISVLDIIKKVNMSLNGDDPTFHKIPDSSEAVAQLLFLYTMGLPQGRDLNDRMTLDKQSMRLTMLWSIQDSTTYVKKVEEIDRKIVEFGLVGGVNGKIPLYQKMNGYVVDTLVQSSWSSIWQITLLLIFMFGSVTYGVLAMIPNLMPMPFILAFMSVFNVPLDLGTALVVSVALGIAVDDTIHFMNTFVYNVKKGMGLEKNLATIMKFTAPALTLTTVTLVGGFGIFTVGDFVPNVRFGALTSIGLLFALTFDLIFVPALILASRRFIEPKAKTKVTKESEKGTQEKEMVSDFGDAIPT